MKEAPKQPLVIVGLESRNVKRLTAVDITPKGHMVVIGGKNANGKTSVLDSIEMALGGGKKVCERPVHDGEEKGYTIVDLGEIIVKRTYTKGGSSTVTVESKEGARYPGPQAILDRLNSTLTFDPLAFTKMDDAKQLNTLRTLVGVNTEEVDNERSIAYNKRTDVNRDLERAKVTLAAERAKLTAQERPKTAPDMAKLLDQQKQQLATNQKNDKARAGLQSLKSSLVSENRELESHQSAMKSNLEFQKKQKDDKIANLEARIEELELQLETAREKLAAAKEIKIIHGGVLLENVNKSKASVQAIENRIKDGEEYVATLVDEDTEATAAEIANVSAAIEEFNRWAVVDEKQKEVQRLADESARLTNVIEASDKKKKDMIASAKYPVPGLSLGDNGIVFNGIPFSQASAAEKLRVSIAIGIALNPRLRVFLIRDGSLLDDDSMQIIADMARESGSQVWIERVSTGSECSVIIEDGRVKETREDDLFSK